MDEWIEFKVFDKVKSMYYQARPFSTDISAAWEIVDKMRLDIWSINPTADCFNVVYDYGNEVVQGEKAPEAICKAALLIKLKKQSG